MSSESKSQPMVESEVDASAPAKSAGRSAESGLVAALGWACVLGGLALSFGPMVSWKAGKIAAGLTTLGIQGGTFVIGGLALIGVAMVRRAVESLRRDSTSDDALVLEQVATDLIEVREALDESRERNARLESELSALRGEVAAFAHSPQTTPQPGVSADALFQLASSLDKLGVRFEQRLKLHHTSLQDSLEELSATIEHTRRNLEARWDAAHAPRHDDSTDTFNPNVVAAPIDLIESEVEASADEVPAPSLGLLDSFEDEVPPALPATHDNGVNFDALDGATPRLRNELDLAARAPRENWSAAQPSATPPTPSLFTEDELRSALDQMRREG